MIHTIEPVKLRHKILPFIVCMDLCMCVASGHSAPTLTDIEVAATNRGLIVSLSGDGPFTATAKVTPGKTAGQSVVVFKVDNIGYGISRLQYTPSPAGPITMITAKVAGQKKSVELRLTVTSTLASQTIAIKERQNSIIAMLSSNPFTDFSWKASADPGPAAPPSAVRQQADSVKGRAISSQSATVQSVQIKPSPALLENKPNSPATAVSDTLAITNVKSLYRGICEQLIFECSAPVSVRVKREADKIMVLFMNTISRLSRKQYTISDSTLFSSFELKEVNYKGTQWTLVTVQLKTIPDGSLIVERRKDHIVLGIPHAGAERLWMWSTDNDHALTYDFVDIPRSSIDYQKFGKKAMADAKRDLNSNSMFSLETTDAVPTHPPARADSIKTTDKAPLQPANIPEGPSPVVKETPVTPPALSEKPAVPVPSATQTPALPKPSVRLVVIKDRVNLRNGPSNENESNIITRLSTGTIGTRLERKTSWIKIDFTGQIGWISNTMVKESTLITAEEWRQIDMRKKPVRADDLKEEQLSIPQGKSALSTALNNVMPDKTPAPVDSHTLIETQKTAPKRETVVYHEYGRDPFLPLSKEGEGNYELPKVENLRLVGVLYDQKDRIALFEDYFNAGQAYALREKDKVEHGALLKIDRNEAVFLIDEMGISRTYSLKLQKNEKLQ